MLSRLSSPWLQNWPEWLWCEKGIFSGFLFAFFQKESIGGYQKVPTDLNFHKKKCRGKQLALTSSRGQLL